MVFPNDEGAGELEEWGNSNWVEHQFWKKRFLNFLGKKTPKKPPFPHVAAFQLPSRIGMNKTFFGNQFDIH